MVKEESKHQFVVLKSMFLSGSVKRMRDIEKLYPSQVSKALGMNHSRYIHKLYNPEEFKFKNIKALANLINIDIQIILNVLINESNAASKSISKKNK